MSTSHSVSTVNIYHKNQPKIVPLTNSLLVSNGWFIESFPILAFNLENKQNIDKISLYFNTIKSDGTLKIKLNDNPVMEENIQEGIKIIDLPKTNLQEKDNKLEFKTSFPFWIWSTNDYQLKDVGVKINYELVNTKEERTFVLAEDEKSNIKSARLEYYQQCNSDTKGQKYPLKIYINDKKLFDGNILCIEGRIAHEVSLTNLLAGENKLLFVLEEGDFTFSDIQLLTKLKSSVYPTYYFTVNKNQIDDLKDGASQAKLKFYFDDNVALKKAKISVDSQEFFIDTRASDFTYDITPCLTQGTNFIKIIPLNSFNIIGMKVYIE